MDILSDYTGTQIDMLGKRPAITDVVACIMKNNKFAHQLDYSPTPHFMCIVKCFNIPQDDEEINIQWTKT